MRGDVFTATFNGTPSETHFSIAYAGGDGKHVIAKLIAEDNPGGSTCVVGGRMLG
jgi:hypothetical protein